MNIQERVAVLEAKLQALEVRVARAESERTWAVQLVLGLIIAAVVGTVLVGSGVGK